MILVNVNQTWPAVQAGVMSAEQSTLGDWGQLSAKNIEDHGDLIFGVYDNTIVSAYVIDGHEWTRDPGGNYRLDRVAFEGHPDPQWSQFIGSPNPGKQWGQRGYARSVQALPTSRLTDSTEPVSEVEPGGPRRATVDGYTLTVDGTGAYVIPPAGGRVTILTPA